MLIIVVCFDDLLERGGKGGGTGNGKRMRDGYRENENPAVRHHKIVPTKKRGLSHELHQRTRGCIYSDAPALFFFVARRG